MNRTNLSPATSAIVLRLLTAEVDRAEEAFRVAGVAFETADKRFCRVPNTGAKYAIRQEALRQKDSAERVAREVRWALAEYRRAAGLDVDHDAAEATAQ